PHNAGAALRSCDAFGIQQVHLVVVNQRFRTSVRVTQGCEKWLDVRRHASPDECVHALKDAGFRLFAAVPGAPLSVDEVDARTPLALAFGNEHLGLGPRLRERCDGEFSIPMYGASQSLNVSVSVAISLRAVAEARRRAVGRPG